MPDTRISENSKRVAKNTVLLYFRMFVTMLVGLYTSRVILNALGQDDFGIYGAVGGVVAMFSILTGAIAGAISRFLTFELGKSDDNRLGAVFSTAMAIQLGLALIILLIAEVAGIWFLNAKMNIPEGRMGAANWVLQCSILMFLVNMWSVPFNAAIIAHEKMQAFAYISIAEALMMLGIAIFVKYTAGDKLVTYAILMLAVALIVRILYGIYAKHRFRECRFRARLVEKGIAREMASFSGWTFIGNGFFVLNTQGVNILMNLFFGVQVNAARDVAVKFEGMVSKFTNNFMTALHPQITKSYAANDLGYLHELVCKGSKYSYFLVYFFALPIILEAPKIMEIWLLNVPAHAVEFVRISLISLLFMSAGDSFLKAINATGKIARYQKVVLITAVWVFPLTYWAFKSGLAPEWSYVILTVVNIIVVAERVIICSRLTGLSIKKVFADVVTKAFSVTIAASVLPVLVCLLFPPTGWRTLAVLGISAVSTLGATYFLGTTPGERNAIVDFFKQRLHR